MTLERKFEHYRCAQRDFNEAYKLVDHYVKDLYLLPKRLVENTAPALDKYIKEYSFPDGRAKNTTSFDVVLDFIDQLDDFTENTVHLFEEHKRHAKRSNTYLKKVEMLKRKNAGKETRECATKFVELTPELTELHNGLKNIKAQADEMVDKLEGLELRWNILRVNVSA
jgi:hypothetical protein